ncbi:putative transposase [Nitrobacteraceae bacterium AZCC 2161]
MQQRTERRHKFGRHDRLRISGAAYRVVSKNSGVFQLQLVSGEILQDHYVNKSDADINLLLKDGKLGYDRDYFSKTLGLLRQRNDTSDLTDLDEESLRTIAWKTEWCVRFHRRRLDPNAPWRPTHTQRHLERFIDAEKDAMDRWYLDLSGVRRRPGRRIKGAVRKAFDYPCASSLRDWLRLYRMSGERIEAFRPGYDRCGNRAQLPVIVTETIDRCVRDFPASNKFNMNHIYESIEADLDVLNASRSERDQLYVSPTAVRRRIHKIDPFIFDAGRSGLDRAIRKYSPVGIGLSVYVPMERVEMDDWEMDLQSLLAKTEAWRQMSRAQKDAVTRERCTVTVGIDNATRCIVGYHLSALPPGSQNSKAALRTTMLDKSALAKLGGCKSDWPMFGPVHSLATDGGPAFNGKDFEEVVRLSTIDRVMPNQDPRMRGTIEAFFRYFKRVCRYFAGQTFANTVERGDYPAEKMASATFEAILQHSIRFIVDIYHHRPHRGLEGRTPYEMWKRLTANGVGVVSSLQLTRAFSYKDARVIDKHGITSLALSYNSIPLALLGARTGRQLVPFFVNPLDLGEILVLVPKEHRKIKEIALSMGGSDYLTVKCVDGVGKDRTLEQHSLARKELRAIAKAEETKGKIWRFAAHRDLLSAGDRARKDAGLDQFGLTQDQYKRFSDAIHRNGHAAFSNRPIPRNGMKLIESYGERVDVLSGGGTPIDVENASGAAVASDSAGERVVINSQNKPKKKIPGRTVTRSSRSTAASDQTPPFSGSINSFKRKP